MQVDSHIGVVLHPDFTEAYTHSRDGWSCTQDRKKGAPSAGWSMPKMRDLGDELFVLGRVARNCTGIYGVGRGGQHFLTLSPRTTISRRDSTELQITEAGLARARTRTRGEAPAQAGGGPALPTVALKRTARPGASENGPSETRTNASKRTCCRRRRH